MDWSRFVVRAAILAAVLGGVAMFFVLSLHPRPAGAPPVPGVASDR
jgi:hypothetical protein